MVRHLNHSILNHRPKAATFLTDHFGFGKEYGTQATLQPCGNVPWWKEYKLILEETDALEHTL
jgi:hypothetical protein